MWRSHGFEEKSNDRYKQLKKHLDIIFTKAELAESNWEGTNEKIRLDKEKIKPVTGTLTLAQIYWYCQSDIIIASSDNIL